AAKRHLFEGTDAGAPDVAVINADDSYSTRLARLAQRTLTYGIKAGAVSTSRRRRRQGKWKCDRRSWGASTFTTFLQPSERGSVWQFLSLRSREELRISRLSL